MSFRHLFLVLLAFFSALIPVASAEEPGDEDFLSPSQLVIDLQPGEKFSLDVFFASKKGGLYDVFHGEFFFDDEGGKQFTENILPFLELSHTELDVDPDGQVVMKVSGVVPDDAEHSNVLYAIRVRRRPKEKDVFTHQLPSLLHFRIGKISAGDVHIQDISPELDEEGRIDKVSFGVSNSSSSTVVYHSELHFLDEEGGLIDLLLSKEVFIAPGRSRTTGFYWFDDQDYEFSTEVADVDLVVKREGEQEVARERLSLSDSVTTVRAHQQHESAYKPDLKLRVGKSFTWTERAGHFLLIIMGLFLVLRALYPKKR